MSPRITVETNGLKAVLDYLPSSFSVGTTEPTWDNVGCRVPVANLKRLDTTNLITEYAGQIIDGIHLPKGRIEVRHPGVLIRNGIAQVGYDPNRQYIQNNCGIVAHPSYDTRGLVVEDFTVDPVNAANPATATIPNARDTAGNDAQTSGIFGYGITARRVAIRNVTDGFMPDVRPGFMEPSLLEACFVQTRYLGYDKEQTDGTHNDGVQLAGGNGHVVRGNALRNPTGGVIDPVSGKQVKGQCIVFTPYHGSLDDCVIDRNWLYGAYTQLAAWVPKAYGPQPLRLTATGNRHGGSTVWAMLITPEVNTAKKSIAGNVAAAGGLKWNQSGAQSGISTIAAGGTVNPTIATAG